MAHAGDVVAEEKTPAADAFEPVMDPLIAFFGDMKVAAVLVNQLEPVDVSEQVTDGDSGDASQERHGESEYRLQVAFENQISRKNQKGFVRYRQPDDAEHHQEEQRDRSVMGDPAEHGFHVWIGSSRLDRNEVE